MPTAATSILIEASSDAIFALLHDYERRTEWDPMLRAAYLLDGAAEAGRGVSSRCCARWWLGGWEMDTVYVSFRPPQVAAVKMTCGPAFLASFAASIRHEAIHSAQTRVTYTYHFEPRPAWLGPILIPIFNRVFYRETQARLRALKAFLERPQPGSAPRTLGASR